MIYQVVDKEDLDKQLLEVGEKLAVVEFFAIWCGPCKFATPEYETIANEFTNVVFMKIDADDNEALMLEFEITALPTYLFFKSNKLVDKYIGSQLENFRKIIETHAK